MNQSRKKSDSSRIFLANLYSLKNEKKKDAIKMIDRDWFNTFFAPTCLIRNWFAVTCLDKCFFGWFDILLTLGGSHMSG